MHGENPEADTLGRGGAGNAPEDSGLYLKDIGKRLTICIVLYRQMIQSYFKFVEMAVVVILSMDRKRVGLEAAGPGWGG